MTTQTEHNSGLRPLANKVKGERKGLNDDGGKGLSGDNGEVLSGDNDEGLSGDKLPDWIVPCDEFGRVSVEAVEAVLRRMDCRGGLLIVNHCSNVTGAVQDAAALAALAHSYGMLFMLDAAQSAGCLPIDIDGWGIDLMAFTAHKALFGAPGTGGYYVRQGIPFRPLLYGGTGLDSSRIVYSNDYEYEVGTQNLPGIAALNAGAEYVLNRGMHNIIVNEERKMAWLRQALSQCQGVTLYAPNLSDKLCPDLSDKLCPTLSEKLCPTLSDKPAFGPVLSFTINGLEPRDIGYILQNAYNITVRTGLHCSPLIHHALHTAPLGTVRISISDLTTMSDLEALVAAIREITS